MGRLGLVFATVLAAGCASDTGMVEGLADETGAIAMAQDPELVGIWANFAGTCALAFGFSVNDQFRHIKLCQPPNSAQITDGVYLLEDNLLTLFAHQSSCADIPSEKTYRFRILARDTLVLEDPSGLHAFEKRDRDPDDGGGDGALQYGCYAVPSGQFTPGPILPI